MDAQTLIAAMRATAAAPPRPITVAGWGDLFVRQPTVAEVDIARREAEASDGMELARGACRVICDSSGARVFDPGNSEHVALVASQPWALLQQVIAAASGKEHDEGK